MDTIVWTELRSLLRSVALAPSASRIVAGASRKAGEFIRAFEHTVRPIVDTSITDPAQRAQVTEALLSYATKTCFVIAGYARMTGVPFASDVAVLGLSFTRLYDDLFDRADYQDLDERLHALFEHNVFTPSADLELLLYRLYREIDLKLDREHDDPIYAAVSAVHDYQIRARCQSDPLASRSTLEEVTFGKGGQGTLAVFALMRAGLGERERQLILEIGEVLQLMDDYLDIDEDTLAHSRTLATEGHLGLPDVCRRLRVARVKLIAYYGRRSTREFFGVCYLTLWMCFLRRRWPRRAGPGRALSPWDVVSRPGGSVIPDVIPD